jgi:hypothetical protein
VEKRRADRISIGFRAELVSGETSYNVDVDNLSPDGACVITFPTDVPVAFERDNVFELRLHLFSGDLLNLQCRVIWAKKTPTHGLTWKVGLEIINPAWDRINSFL